MPRRNSYRDVRAQEAADNVERRALPAGSMIGKYRVMSTLGRSVVGVSYLAEQLPLGRQVKLEMPDEAEGDSAGPALGDMSRYVRLDHSSIPTLFDMDTHDGTPFAAWEHITGWDLEQIVASRGSPPILVTLRIMSTVAAATQHAHDRDIVHGSIWPGNVVVGSQGQPMLCGFWLSTPSTFSLPGHEKDTLGPLLYRSPEQARGYAPNVVSDVWGLGATLFFALTGRVPSEGSSAWEVVNNLMSPAPIDIAPLQGAAPDYVVRIVEKCLRKSPADRYGSADEVKRALDAAIDHHELESMETAQLVFPKAGQTLLLHSEYGESGMTGSYREFDIESRIGGGGFAEVFRAKAMHSGETVALKILQRQWLENLEAVERFRREARLLSQITHPNVVCVRSFGRFGPSFYIAMEMLDSRTLRAVIEERGQLAVDQASGYLLPVLAALAAVHEAGIVHRDVKPANISVAKDRIVLFDFNMAHMSDLTRLTMAGIFVGTPDYASPEQALGDKVTMASDVYSAGVVLYEMLSGHVPHEGESAVSVLKKIATEPPTAIAQHRGDLPTAVIDLLRRMLAREPDRRPGASEARELLAAAGG